ncbi:ATP-binding protein [Bacillus xiapuensis]|uniref:ATP-binding protein n=1 Tax=Bacillus xiapuensis TaxID=2014075 RepID=UPI001E4037FA|nr:ATP-binding protein [Bacillus xiapuensis]
MADFYWQQSLLVTSNLEFSGGDCILSDSRLTAAPVDCLIYRIRFISYEAESYRLTRCPVTNKITEVFIGERLCKKRCTFF